MSNHRFKQVKPPEQKPQPRYSDAVRKWGDAWSLGASGGALTHNERTHDALDAALMKLMEQGVIRRVA